MRRVVIGALIVVLAGGGGYAAWRLLGARAEEATIAGGPRTAAAVEGDILVTVGATATLEPVRTASFTAPAATTVLAVRRVGEAVKTGESVIELDLTPFLESVEQARIRLTQAERKLESARVSARSNASSRTASMANAEADHAAAQRALEDARATLARTRELHSVRGATDVELRDAESRVASAETTLQRATNTLRNLRDTHPLAEEQDRAQIGDAQLSLQQARIDLDVAARNLEAARVAAPFDGVVATLSVKVGDRVSANAVLATVVDASALVVNLLVDELDVSRIAPGMAVRVRADAAGSIPGVARLESIGPVAQVTQNIASFPAVAILENPDGRFRPGMTADAEIIITEARGLVLVPSLAVQTVRNRTYVTVLAEDRTEELTPVTTGPSDGLRTAITAGLEAGMQVAIPETSAAQSSTRTGFGQGGAGSVFQQFQLPAGGPR